MLPRSRGGLCARRSTRLLARRAAAASFSTRALVSDQCSPPSTPALSASCDGCDGEETQSAPRSQKASLTPLEGALWPPPRRHGQVQGRCQASASRSRRGRAQGVRGAPDPQVVRVRPPEPQVQAPVVHRRGGKQCAPGEGPRSAAAEQGAAPCLLPRSVAAPQTLHPPMPPRPRPPRPRSSQSTWRMTVIARTVKMLCRSLLRWEAARGGQISAARRMRLHAIACDCMRIACGRMQLHATCMRLHATCMQRACDCMQP